MVRCGLGMCCGRDALVSVGRLLWLGGGRWEETYAHDVSYNRDLLEDWD